MIITCGFGYACFKHVFRILACARTFIMVTSFCGPCNFKDFFQWAFRIGTPCDFLLESGFRYGKRVSSRCFICNIFCSCGVHFFQANLRHGVRLTFFTFCVNKCYPSTSRGVSRYPICSVLYDVRKEMFLFVVIIR